MDSYRRPVFASMRVQFVHLFTLWETIRAPLDVVMIVKSERSCKT